jgi:hypothetical protein
VIPHLVPEIKKPPHAKNVGGNVADLCQSDSKMEGQKRKNPQEAGFGRKSGLWEKG